MPNFYTHWLVAIQVLDSIPEIKAGYNIYRDRTADFADDLRKSVLNTKKYTDFDSIQTGLDNLVASYDFQLKTIDHDAVTCFSAYMLGACGPDFWTLPSGSFCSTAGIHFDLGHYNRTHRQFEKAVERNKNKNRNSLQFKIERAYYLGMSTHFAADLILHELVNVYAGAYSLLTNEWENEHGNRNSSGLAKRWNTHNKVEHFWDSYIRYRYLGDNGPLFGYTDNDDIVNRLNLPLAEKLLDDVERTPDSDFENGLLSFSVKTKLKSWLQLDKVKFQIERPFNFPRIAVDRLLARNGCSPFIYDIVVNKTSGAYEDDIIFPDAKKEAESRQMNFNKGKNEGNKLSFFSTDRNKAMTTGDSNNYLTYIVCPDRARVREYGKNTFFHLNALKPFIKSATAVGKRFTSCVSAAFGSGRVSHLFELRSFWNLDTGLGLQIKNILSDTGKEVITEMNFKHITAEPTLGAAKIYYQYAPSLKCMSKKGGARKSKTFDTLSYDPAPICAFPVGTKNAVDNILLVEDFADRFMNRIRITQRAPLVNEATIDDFFASADKQFPQNKLSNVMSACIQPVNELQLAAIRHRLNLIIKTSIPHITVNSLDDVNFYVLGDKSFDPLKHKDHRVTKWLKDKNTKPIIRSKDPTGPDRRNLWDFASNYLINFENDTTLKSKTARGEWNNVIEYDKYKSYYCRNYSVSTGRKYVLHPDGDGNFWADKDFTYFTDVSPTEHIFFSLYLLVKTSQGVFDMLSKKQLSKDDLQKIKKIDCLNVLKIILFYVLDSNGAAQIGQCYVDGLPVQVSRITQ
jgi:hypothetical protein